MGETTRFERLVTSGIFSLDGGDFEVDNNVWLVGDEHEVIVVDAAHDAEAILAAVDGRRLLAVVCTHGHNDHINAAGAVADATGAPILLHPADRMLWDVVHPDREPSPLTDGQVISVAGLDLTVLHTPGHAPGHLCFHEPEINALVVGDMVASIGTILIAPGEGHMGTYLAQLSRLATIGAGVGLPAHGDPIATPTTLFERYIAHRLLREQKVKRALEAFGESGATLSELVATAYDDTPKEIWTIAELSLAAHLEKLVEEGAVRQVEHRYTVAIA